MNIESEPPEPEEEKIPERPLACSECKKPLAVYYTEIVENVYTQTAHCAECPELQKKMHGMASGDTQRTCSIEGEKVACGNCGITLSSLKVGHPLGCSDCYEVFGALLPMEIMAAKKLSKRSVKNSRMPIHTGRSPEETPYLNPSLRLLALNEALDETLKREDYEQAALLRDEIKQLTQETETKDPQDELKK